MKSSPENKIDCMNTFERLIYNLPISSTIYLFDGKGGLIQAWAKICTTLCILQLRSVLEKV